MAPVDSDVVGLSATAGVDERRAVSISTPEAPSREAVESHLLTHIPFAPWCRACIFGRGRESPHFRQSREEPAATPVISLEYFSWVCRTALELESYLHLLCVMETPRTVLV